MKNKKLDFDNLYLHDAILHSIKIKNIEETGGIINICLSVYLTQESKNRSKIKLIFKSVEKLVISTDFYTLFNNKISGNIDLGYIYNGGYILNLFGGIIMIESQKKPKILRNCKVTL